MNTQELAVERIEAAVNQIAADLGLVNPELIARKASSAAISADQESVNMTDQRVKELLNVIERYEKNAVHMDKTTNTLRSELTVASCATSKYLGEMIRAEQALRWIGEKRDSTRFLEVERECWELSNNVIEKSLEEFKLLHNFDWKQGNPYKLTSSMIANFMNRVAYHAEDPREVLRETARSITSAEYQFLKEFGSELVFIEYPEKENYL